MPRDPDTLETTATGDRSANDAAGNPAMEFATPPTRAERAVPREGRSQPLWPWLVLLALAVVAALVVLAVR